jgi:hypothetical protein
MMERVVQEIELPGGQVVLAVVRVLEPGALPEGPGEGYDFEDTGALDRLGVRVGQLNELVASVGSAVFDAARSARPDEVSATFGIEIGVKPGKAVAMLADGEAKGSISVTLTWRPGSASESQVPAGQGQSGQAESGHAQSVPAQQPLPAQQPQGSAGSGHVLPGQAQPGAGLGGPGPAGSGQGPTTQPQ